MEDAATRRARLKKLREAAEALEQVDQPDSGAAAAEEIAPKEKAEAEEPTLKFRNYAPKDEKIAHEKVRNNDHLINNMIEIHVLIFQFMILQVEAAKAPEFEEIKVDLDAVIGHAPEEVIINVAPKAANYDLRRDIAPKLAKLERRTQKAMIQLMAQEEQQRQASGGA